LIKQKNSVLLLDEFVVRLAEEGHVDSVERVVLGGTSKADSTAQHVVVVADLNEMNYVAREGTKYLLEHILDMLLLQLVTMAYEELVREAREEETLVLLVGVAVASLLDKVKTADRRLWLFGLLLLLGSHRLAYKCTI